jgi:hypothetical protein
MNKEKISDQTINEHAEAWARFLYSVWSKRKLKEKQENEQPRE